MSTLTNQFSPTNATPLLARKTRHKKKVPAKQQDVDPLNPSSSLKIPIRPDLILQNSVDDDYEEEYYDDDEDGEYEEEDATTYEPIKESPRNNSAPTLLPEASINLLTKVMELKQEHDEDDEAWNDTN